MNPEPFSFQYPIADFDLTKLPVDPALLRENPAMLVSAVQTFYQESFRKLGGVANIAVKPKSVNGKAPNLARKLIEWANGVSNCPSQSSLKR